MTAPMRVALAAALAAALLPGCVSSQDDALEACRYLSLGVDVDRAITDFNGTLGLVLTFWNGGEADTTVLPYRDPDSGSLAIARASEWDAVEPTRLDAHALPPFRDADLLRVPAGGSAEQLYVYSGEWPVAPGDLIRLTVTYGYLDSADPGQVTHHFCGASLTASRILSW